MSGWQGLKPHSGSLETATMITPKLWTREAMLTQKAHLYFWGKCNPVPSLPGCPGPRFAAKISCWIYFCLKSNAHLLQAAPITGTVYLVCFPIIGSLLLGCSGAAFLIFSSLPSSFSFHSTEAWVSVQMKNSLLENGSSSWVALLERDWNKISLSSCGEQRPICWNCWKGWHWPLSF